MNIEYKEDDIKYKENNDNKNIKSKGKIISKQDHGKHKIIALIVTILFIILWIIVIYVSKDLLIVNKYMIILFAIPIIVMIYHLKIINKSLDESKTYEQEKKMIMHKIKEEHELAKLIPVAVFGLSLLLGRVSNDLLRTVCPFLLLSIGFGTIIPFFVVFLNAQDSSIEKLIASEVLQFCSEAVAFGNLMPVIFLPFLYFYKKNGKKFNNAKML